MIVSIGLWVSTTNATTNAAQLTLSTTNCGRTCRYHGVWRPPPKTRGRKTRHRNAHQALSDIRRHPL